jgi:glycosyltransferase involved in cell wall biosynthesis
MKILIATDAWHPQVNGVVNTLNNTRIEAEGLGHEVCMITPLDFRFSVPCPTYPEIRLSLWVRRVLRQKVLEFGPQAIHISTEGPIGQAMRKLALEWGLPFTTAFHTRFPEYLWKKFYLPEAWTYSALRSFHAVSKRVLAPTPSMQEELERHGIERVCQWSRGVDVSLFRPRSERRLDLPRPIFTCVGRVSIEKNLKAFLDLELPGSKIIVGDGPQLRQYKRRYKQAHFTGTKRGEELGQIYSDSDVFVFPSLTDTYGLVLLEALASGVPVAAYRITGPRDVIGTSPVGRLVEPNGGDLRQAALEALEIDRAQCRAFAERKTWRLSTEQFLSHLVPFNADWPVLRLAPTARAA